MKVLNLIVILIMQLVIILCVAQTEKHFESKTIFEKKDYKKIREICLSLFLSMAHRSSFILVKIFFVGLLEKKAIYNTCLDGAHDAFLTVAFLVHLSTIIFAIIEFMYALVNIIIKNAYAIETLKFSVKDKKIKIPFSFILAEIEIFTIVALLVVSVKIIIEYNIF